LASSGPAHAVELYRAGAARAVSCLTRAHIDVGSGYAREDVPHALLMAAGDPVGLRGDHPLTLSIGEQYRITETPDGGWEARTTAYFYAIGQQQAGDLLAYHWHPRGRGHVGHPHMHVSAHAQGDVGWIGKLHLPTGAIGLHDVLLLAIEELGATPIRPDWEAILRGPAGAQGA
jgi:hypothetical protein